MNSKHLWTAALSGALLTTFVSNAPVIGLVNILCFAGFWASAIFAVWLYRRLNGSVTSREGLLVGALTGLCAGVLGFALSFAGLAGFQGLANALAQVIPAEDMQNVRDVPAMGVLAFNLVGVTFNLAFGAIGGLIGGAIFRARPVIDKVGVPS